MNDPLNLPEHHLDIVGFPGFLRHDITPTRLGKTNHDLKLQQRTKNISRVHTGDLAARQSSSTHCGSFCRGLGILSVLPIRANPLQVRVNGFT